LALLDQPHEVVRLEPNTLSRRRLFSTTRLRGEGTKARRAWRGAYVRRILIGDSLAASLAALVGYLVKFGPESGSIAAPHSPLWAACLLPVVWIGTLLFARTYERRMLWVGPDEFRRVFIACVMVLAAVGTISWAFKLELARGFVVLALPLAAALTLSNRVVQRYWLKRQRAHGRHNQTAILVGHQAGVAALHEQIERHAEHGYQVIGFCLPGGGLGERALSFEGLPVLGDLDDVVDVVTKYEVDTVAVLPSPELDGPALRRLGWELEQTDAELLLAPAVTEVAGPRVRIRPVWGLPLMHMERPEFKGVRRVAKDVFDRTAAALALLVFAPALIVLAAAVRFTSRGPVFFRHERIGRDGQPFHVLKFRSMVDGAHKEVDTLFQQNEGNDVQFKMKADPRVTKVGQFLRRYSLDELPQLFNVLGGSMSLVGPRPHVTREVEQYGYDMRRRLLVKPGITGLWQVSGRSDLSWDDSVRIDVRYVENWSLAFDLMILWKTVGAVFRGSGAY
jgi:exopolysaccharide biosynthesis polyprenyl glycosylphosphotransferase